MLDICQSVTKYAHLLKVQRALGISIHVLEQFDKCL